MSSNSNGAIAVAEQEPTALTPVRAMDLLPSQAAWAQMGQMAVAAYKSGLMPNDMKNAEAALTTALKGYELGVPFMAAIEGIHLIKGKATVGAHLMLALIKRAYGGQAIRVAKTDANACTIEYREPGWDGVASYTFTIEDAQKAGLTGNRDSNWSKYPAAMLRARAISAVGKMAFPEVIGGMYVAGELGDAVLVTDDGDVVPDLRAAEPRQESPPIQVRSPAPESPIDITRTRGWAGGDATVQEAEYRDVQPSEEMTWNDCFQVLRTEFGLPHKNAVAKHLGRDSIEGLTPQQVHDLVMGNSATAAPAEPLITPAQNSALHAIAGDLFGADGHTVIHALAGLNYGVESVTKLTRTDASHLLDTLKNDADVTGIREYIARAQGQQQMPLDGPVEIGPEEAALIAFRERAEAGEHFLELLEEAGDREDYLCALVTTTNTLGQHKTTVDRAKQLGRYTVRFIAAERARKQELEQRAAAYRDR